MTSRTGPLWKNATSQLHLGIINEYPLIHTIQACRGQLQCPLDCLEMVEGPPLQLYVIIIPMKGIWKSSDTESQLQMLFSQNTEIKSFSLEMCIGSCGCGFGDPLDLSVFVSHLWIGSYWPLTDSRETIYSADWVREGPISWELSLKQQALEKAREAVSVFKNTWGLCGFHPLVSHTYRKIH